ncbi:MAG: helix-turn-helix transcriptional regulator [Erythrobacter sp.]|uniref:helix-turn-helix domain-containing protein n=1 Tax=Erythrobacter sp. TaxID=1042 RepID=UPI0025D6FAD6|nr:helix-turn-helix transcriptional regulator [Erythrobacter sp.]MCM0001108.1 helix-turn-helix transcriptional regulator [Erythrobacter sp.]
MESLGVSVETSGHCSDTLSDELQSPLARTAAFPESQPPFGAEHQSPQLGLLEYRSGSRYSQQSFNALFRSLRYAAGLTLQQVADAVGVSKPTVWAWEHGRAKPSREKVDGIAEALGVAPDLLTFAARNRALIRMDPSDSAADGSYRDALISEGRAMIAQAYEVAPSAVRIFVEVDGL